MTPSSARPRRTSASTRQRARRKTKAPGSSKLSGVSCGWSRVLPRYVEEFRSHTLNNSNCLGPAFKRHFVDVSLLSTPAPCAEPRPLSFVVSTHGITWFSQSLLGRTQTLILSRRASAVSKDGRQPLLPQSGLTPAGANFALRYAASPLLRVRRSGRPRRTGKVLFPPTPPHPSLP